MLKMLGKLIAAWLTAFAIAGTTVWAASDDASADPEQPPAGHGQAAGPASAAPVNAAD